MKTVEVAQIRHYISKARMEGVITTMLPPVDGEYGIRIKWDGRTVETTDADEAYDWLRKAARDRYTLYRGNRYRQTGIQGGN